MNRAIRASAFTASLFVASLAFAQVAAPGAAPAADQPAATTPPPAAAPKTELTPQQQKIADLIKQLAADDFPTRDAASNELLKIGPEALPALREALRNEDPSIQSYAEYLVPRIEGQRDGRDGRRLNAPRRIGGGQQPGIVGGGRMMQGGDVNVARIGGGRMAMNVTANDRTRTTNIIDGDRKVLIDEGPDGIRLSVTDTENGKTTQKDYKAQSIEELRKDNPEAADIYDKYTARGRGLNINGNARGLRLAPGNLNGLDAQAQRQVEDAVRLQEQAMQQQRAQLRDLANNQNLDVRDRQLELMHRQLQVETEMLERRLAEVEAMHKQLLEQTKAAQKRLAELEKQQQDRGQQEKQERAR